MKKILLSVLTVAVVAGVAFGATRAFFSDTETSKDNSFTAGAIDLKIDNESYAIDYNIPNYPTPTGALVASTHTTWELKDLTVEKFFDFIDLKPGDYGEDTISIHVGSNDAWMCAAAKITDDSDQTCTEPEKADDSTCFDPSGDGELDEDVYFAFWVDDGDNVFENDEKTFLTGPLSGLDSEGKITLADSGSSILGDAKPIPGGTTFYIGKAWCFGTMSPNPVIQDGNNNGSPLTLGTGFNCDGSEVDNAAQTDKVVGDLQFYAEQSRNNSVFDCEEGYTPQWPQ